MVARRGNSSNYESKNGQKRAIGLTPDTSIDALAEAWAKARLRDRFDGAYNVAKREPCPSLSGHDLKLALQYLFKATEDPAFEKAAHALEDRGLAKHKGLKDIVTDSLSNKVAALTGAYRMRAWIEQEDVTVAEAARLVASQLGLPLTKSDDSINAYGKALTEHLAERESAFHRLADRSPRGVRVFNETWDTLYKEKMEPLVKDVVADFRTVTKDLEEKYRALAAELADEFAETF